jgi:predicted O-methyltransferase YrrM
MEKKYSLRFNPNPEWNRQIIGNRYFVGLYEMCKYMGFALQGREDMKMIEIGSYMGESTFIFASQLLFKEIICIDPLSGEELFNEMSNRTWDEVRREFWTNTRHWDNIRLFQDYSYNVHGNFEDESVDVVYIDGNHGYDDVTNDLKLYLPKIKPGGIICGHDYSDPHPEVIQAVNDFFKKEPEMIFQDSSWAILLR